MRVLATLIIIFLCAACNNLETREVTLPSGAKIIAEVADTPALTERGLMYRKNMDQNKGMIFIFEDEQDRLFWMMNTYIPLDMIFMDSGKVVRCLHNNVPASTPFTSMEDAATAGCADSKYVLEVNAGVALQNNLAVGQRLDF